jgi:hypothetical protein
MLRKKDETITIKLREPAWDKELNPSFFFARRGLAVARASQ